MASNSPALHTASELREWSVAAVKLLQGVVYDDEPKLWDVLLRSKSALESYFGRIGLSLVIDEADGYAFLRQWGDADYPDGHDPLPRLMRRTSMGYTATLLCVLLRDKLRRFEEEEVHNERCVVETEELFEQWRAFVPASSDEVRRRKELGAALSKVEELGFVTKFSPDPEAWEVRRALKARLPVAELERLRDKLAAATAERAGGNGQ